MLTSDGLIDPPSFNLLDKVATGVNIAGTEEQITEAYGAHPRTVWEVLNIINGKREC